MIVNKTCVIVYLFYTLYTYAIGMFEIPTSTPSLQCYNLYVVAKPYGCRQSLGIYSCHNSGQVCILLLQWI